jgi:transcriptional regulator with XRE-family HTH domain
MAEKHPLQVYREQRNLTQEALGELLGVKAATISRWEQGKRSPRSDDLRRISQITGIEPAQMLVLNGAAA